MAAYATVSDVKARAGVLGEAWTEDSTPSESAVEELLEQASSEVDAAFGALGIAVPVVNAIGLRAVTPLVADMTLALAIDATWPGGRGGDDVAEARKAVQARLDRFWGAVASKTQPGLVVYLLGLVGGGDTAGADGANFWTDESDYGRLGSASVGEAASVSRLIRPEFERGMKL